MTTGSTLIVRILAGVLAAVSLGVFAAGAWESLATGIDYDLQQRWLEYQYFRQRSYPNPWVDVPPEGMRRVLSVYLPYAFPMMAPLFEPGGLVQARIAIIILSAASLVTIGAYGWRILSVGGTAWAWAGGFACSAIFVNRSALNLGQFSVICVGLIMLQILLLQRNRPVLAGTCWALAMIKPHIAVAFGALFLLNRQWLGLAWGVAVLIAFSLAALWWTDVPLQSLVGYWIGQETMTFSSEAIGFGPGRFAEWTGLSHRMVQYSILAVLALATTAAAAALRGMRIADLLAAAAICAVLGRLCFYHRPNDQIMLSPLLLACLAAALQRRTAPSVAVASAVALTMWLPLRVQFAVPGGGALQPVIWVMGAAYVAAVQLRPQRGVAITAAAAGAPAVDNPPNGQSVGNRAPP